MVVKAHRKIRNLKRPSELMQLSHVNNHSEQNSSTRDLLKLQGCRITFVLPTLGIGGAERQALLLAHYLKNKTKARVRVLGLRQGPDKLTQLCEDFGIPWSGFPFRWKQKRWQRLTELTRFAHYLRSQKPDIVLPYTFLPNIVCGLTWRFCGAKTCVWNQRDEGLFLNRGRWDRLAVRWTSFFICNSRHARDFMLKNYGIDPVKIQVVNNGILSPSSSHGGRKAWRKKLGLIDDCFLACMVANIHPYKDHFTLFKAWGKVLDKLNGQDAHPVLLLAGKSLGYVDSLKAAASDLQIGSNIRFLGRVDDVGDLLKAVDLCVHSSKTEGCPNAILEAMAVGLPVVATDIPGIREAVGPDGYPFLAPPDDADALADLIWKMLTNERLRSDLGKVMFKRIQKDFNPEKTFTKTAKCLASLI